MDVRTGFVVAAPAGQPLGPRGPPGPGESELVAARAGGEVGFRALLVCSDGDCRAEYEVVGPLAELEAMCCDRGSGLQVLGWPEEAYEAEFPAVRLLLLPLGSSPE
jgi:hypothetical protein